MDQPGGGVAKAGEGGEEGGGYIKYIGFNFFKMYQMKFLFCPILIISCSLSFAQPVRTVTDKQTNAPVPYATIKVLHAPRGIIASDKGEFQLQIDNSDTVLVTSVGYE